MWEVEKATNEKSGIAAVAIILRARSSHLGIILFEQQLHIFVYCIPRLSGSSLRTRAKGMPMPSKGRSLSQWDSTHANQIAAPLTSKLRLETAGQSSIVTGGPSTIWVVGDTKVSAGGGGMVEVEVDEVESQSETAKSKVGIFRQVQKTELKGLRIFDLRSKVPMLSRIHHSKADRFSCINGSSDNSYETRYEIHAQRSSWLALSLQGF